MFQQLGGPDVGCAVAAHFDEAGHDLDGGEGGGEGVGVCAEGLGCACSLVMLFIGGGQRCWGVREMEKGVRGRFSCSVRRWRGFLAI